MIVTFAAAIMDPSGIVNIGIDANRSTFKNGRRRTTRTKTLGGGVFIYDGGMSHGDRTLVFKANVISPEEEAILLHLRDDHSAVTCAVGNEFFTGVIDEVIIDPLVNITYLVKSRLSE